MSISHENHGPQTLSAERILATLAQFGVRVSTEQLLQIQRYLSLLIKWNEAISLTAVSDPEEVIARHFGESMFLVSVLPVENCRLADLGSGAGFPGLALKIMVPQLHVILIESNHKKCAFLFEVIRELGLSDTEVFSGRFEDIRGTRNLADLITARALGDFRTILNWSKTALSARGYLALWLGMEDSAKLSQSPGWHWRPAIKIPDSQRRFLLIGTPAQE